MQDFYYNTAEVDATYINPLNYAADKMNMTVRFSHKQRKINGEYIRQGIIIMENKYGFIEAVLSDKGTTWSLVAYEYDDNNWDGYTASIPFIRKFLEYYQSYIAHK